MNPKYAPTHKSPIYQKIGYLIEEFGEVLQAFGKGVRWGWKSCNPDIAAHYQVTNEDWLKEELKDFGYAISLFRKESTDAHS